MSLRRRLAAVGALFALFGLVAAVRPAVVSGVSTTDLYVTGVGVAAFVMGLRGAIAALGTDSDGIELPAVETRTAARVPGDGFDRDLVARDPGVRDRVERAAVTAVARLEGCSRDEARERVEAGDWTDDRTAAAFLSRAVAPRRSLSDRVRVAVAGHTSGDAVGQARRAVAALSELVGETIATVPSLPDPEDLDRPTRGHAGGLRAAVRHRADGGYGTESPGLPAVGASREYATERWRGIGSLALVAAGVGAVLRRPALLLVAAVGAAVAAYAAYGRAGTVPEIDLAVEREIDPEDPSPGDSVRVTVTVRNESDRRLSDLRYVDGVPAALAVVEGSPRLDARLSPGETVECTYDVAAETGTHRFDPAIAVVRDMTGQRERLRLVETEGAITCRVPQNAQGMGLRDVTLGRSGRIPADVGGTGVEFYGTREYRRGDPVALIDWNRYARTGDLSTIEFREERASSVVVVVDARREAYLAADPGGRPVPRRSAEAAVELVDGLLDGGDLVGVAALSAAREELWLPPGAGRDHRVRARRLLSTHPAVAPTPPDRIFVRSEAVARLRSRLQADAQVVLVSPLADDAVADIVRSLEAGGYAVSVVSPDPTTSDTPGRVLSRVERRLRLSELRAAGVPVFDWDPADPVALAVERAERRRGSA